MTHTIESIAAGLDGLAAVIRKHGTCAPAALEECAQRLRTLAPEASGADAFAAAMKGCQYGEGQTANARHWFMAGYNARLNPAPPTSGEDSNAR